MELSILLYIIYLIVGFIILGVPVSLDILPIIYVIVFFVIIF